MTTLGELMVIARECKGWSQRELAKQAGLNHATIAQVESGHIKEPSFAKIVAMAGALGLSLDRCAAAALASNPVLKGE